MLAFLPGSNFIWTYSVCSGKKIWFQKRGNFEGTQRLFHESIEVLVPRESSRASGTRKTMMSVLFDKFTTTASVFLAIFAHPDRGITRCAVADLLTSDRDLCLVQHSAKPKRRLVSTQLFNNFRIKVCHKLLKSRIAHWTRPIIFDEVRQCF